MTRDWVIDANVGVKFYLPEELAEAALSLLQRLDDGDLSVIVPDLFYNESANIFWKYVRRARLSADDARRSLRNLISLPFTVIPSSDLVPHALDLALEYDITAYDALYVTLARELGISLITADGKLFRKLVGKVTEVRWLGDLNL